MRWFPLDPPWLIIPVIVGFVGAAVVVSRDGSLLLMWVGMLVSIGCATIGLDGWFERWHPRRRDRPR